MRRRDEELGHPVFFSRLHPDAPAPAALKIVPDIIFFDGVIYTGVGMAEDKPEVVEAMAIGAGKVVAVGTTADITRLAGPNTLLRDLDSTSTHLAYEGEARGAAAAPG